VFRVNPGETAEGPGGIVTEAVGAATTKLVELTVDLNATGVGGVRVITKGEVIEALEEFHDYIMRAPWPPA
jgi:hypothetical protein